MPTGPDTSRDQAAGPSPPQRSLTRCALQLMWQNPGMLWTLVREEYRQKWGIALDRRFRDGRSGPPVNLNLNLTRRCNLKCLMCEQHRHDPGMTDALSWYDPRRELPLPAWTAFLDQVASFRPRLYLTGGEPMLYRRFPEFVQAAKKRGLVIHLQTNITLLRQMAEFLVAQGVEMVTVSLDGPQEVHDRIRGQQDAFRRTWDGIHALTEARNRLGRPGPLILLNCVISKTNLATLVEMVPQALEVGADILQLQHTMFNSQANVDRHNQWLNPQWARTQGLELVFPSIPEGEYYQSEIEAEDISLIASAFQEARRRAGNGLKLLSLPNLPPELITLLPGPGISFLPGMQRLVEKRAGFTRRHRVSLPPRGGRQYYGEASPGDLERAADAALPADRRPPPVSWMRPVLQPEFHLMADPAKIPETHPPHPLPPRVNRVVRDG